MNDQQLAKKVKHDAEKVKKDLSTLVGDGAVQFSRLETKAADATGKARMNLTSWVEDGVSHLSKRFKKLSGNAQENVEETAAAAKKDVGHTLSSFNANVQKIADTAPNGFGKKVTRYPWVVISIGLAFGFMLGVLLRPAPRLVEQF